MRRLHNHVMWAAFAAIETASAHPAAVGAICAALKRNQPATFGGWRVLNRRKNSVRRSR